MRTMGSIVTSGCIFLFLCLIGSGCGGTAESEDTLSPEETGPMPGAASSASASSPATSENLLAMEEHESGGVEVALLQVRRAGGDTLNVRWRYRNGTQEEKTLFAGNATWYTPYKLAADAYLIDHVNQKKHLVLTAEDYPITSQTSTHSYGVLTLNSGGTISAWAKFPAPPANVQTISVYIPGTPPFEDVPIGN